MAGNRSLVPNQALPLLAAEVNVEIGRGWPGWWFSASAPRAGRAGKSHISQEILFGLKNAHQLVADALSGDAGREVTP
jgi:hypothetical protein